MITSAKSQLIALLMLVLWAPRVCSFAGQTSSVALSVSLTRARIHGNSLSFDWKIVNQSTKPLYVYATFLNGPAAVPPRNEGGTIKIRTSLGAREPAGVNAYPAARFRVVGPGAFIKGKFTEGRLGHKVLTGANAVEMQVAFGSEIDELKREIHKTSYNGEHPANPIVTWQTTAFGQTRLEK